MKVSEAFSEFAQRKKDISDLNAIPGTFLKWCNYINRFLYRELASVMPEQYMQSQVYTTTPQTATYALPTNFQDIIPMGSGLYLINQAGVDTDMRMPLTGFGSSKTGYYLSPTNIVFTPTPTETKSYRFRYIPLLTDLVAESDDLLIPDRFSYLLMDLLDSAYLVWDEMPSDESWNDERVRQKLHELIQFINPVGQAIMLPDFSADYY
jgi:hypothetical protein